MTLKIGTSTTGTGNSCIFLDKNIKDMIKGSKCLCWQGCSTSITEIRKNNKRQLAPDITITGTEKAWFIY